VPPKPRLPLCGLRDVRDYKVASGGNPTRLGTASPFNIKVTSLRLGDALGERTKGVIDADPHSFVAPDGRLDLAMLLEELTKFWIRHGDVLANRQNDNQAAPQLVIMAYLERIVNCGGRSSGSWSSSTDATMLHRSTNGRASPRRRRPRAAR